jgi:hypothetical protein
VAQVKRSNAFVESMTLDFTNNSCCYTLQIHVLKAGINSRRVVTGKIIIIDS